MGNGVTSSPTLFSGVLDRLPYSTYDRGGQGNAMSGEAGGPTGEFVPACSDSGVRNRAQDEQALLYHQEAEGSTGVLTGRQGIGYRYACKRVMLFNSGRGERLGLRGFRVEENLWGMELKARRAGSPA